MVNVGQVGECSDGRTVTPQLIGVNDLWDIVFAKQPGHEGSRHLRISVALEQEVEHEAVLVHPPPKPVAKTIDARTELIQKPAGTPAGFPLTQAFSKEWAEIDTPFAHCFVTHLDAALVQ